MQEPEGPHGSAVTLEDSRSDVEAQAWEASLILDLAAQHVCMDGMVGNGEWGTARVLAAAIHLFDGRISTGRKNA